MEELKRELAKRRLVPRDATLTLTRASRKGFSKVALSNPCQLLQHLTNRIFIWLKVGMISSEQSVRRVLKRMALMARVDRQA